jgi:hypothetical protein
MVEARGNTKMCSVLFVDIAGYSKETNAKQIVLKERFVSLWTQAIQEVPAGDIMVVDAGDGAAMTALVEPEDTIRVAQRLRDLIVVEAEKAVEPMHLRMGINFGPVQLSHDVHGKDCIVGDAINIAQRVMSFADPGQIMVSRSYYDVILPLSDKYKEILYYLGKRADKHIRYHDIYGLGTPNQSAASLGQSVAEGELHEGDEHIEHVEHEEIKMKQVIPPAAPVEKSVTATTEYVPAAKPRTSTLGQFWRWLLSFLGGIFTLIKLGLVILVVYELFVLVPIMRQPIQVRVELSSQVQAVKDIWAGVREIKDTVEPQFDQPGNQTNPSVGGAQGKSDGKDKSKDKAKEPSAPKAGVGTP